MMIKPKKKSSLKINTRAKNTHKNRSIPNDDNFDDLSDFWIDNYTQKEKTGKEELNTLYNKKFNVLFYI